MLDLSPTKLIIIFVVAIVLLGPKRLPQVARQLGAAWAKVRTFSQRIDSELRQTMPDLPTGRDIVRYARSPIALLNELADGAPGASGLVEDHGAPTGPAGAGPAGAGSDRSDAAGAGGAGSADPARAARARHWPQDLAGAGTNRTAWTHSAAGSTGGRAVADGRAEGLEDAAHVDLARLAVDDPTLN